MAEGNSTFGEIVGREFQSDLITGQNADTIPPKPARQMGEDYPVVLQLDTEQSAGKLLQDRACYFDAILFTHIPFDGGPATKTEGSRPGKTINRQ